MESPPNTIPALLERALEAHGERPALLGASAPPVRYVELGRRVRRRAAELRSAGLLPGERLALLAGNTPLFLEATFACAWRGAVLVPLHARHAPRELAEVLRGAGAELVLAEPEQLELASEAAAVAGARVLPLAPLRERGAEAGAEASVEDPEPADAAQLYFTSGTTGRSKGVVLTHQNVCVHAAWALRELELAPYDRWGHFAPMFHLADAWATLAVTSAGGAHAFVPRFRAADVLETIERQGITVTNLVPTMLTTLVAAAAEPGASFDPGSLRLVLSGGAPITPALVARVLATFRCEYAQTYGMTETSPYLTLGRLTEAERALPEPERLRRLARTGRPFADVELEVVDDEGRPVPADDRTVGEIRVRGASVTPGYWNAPEETAAAFRDGWLLTGDLAVVDASGSVDIVDRRKDMILTGGENVYCTEVERVLAEHAAVREVAVHGTPDETWGELVSAAVVLEPGTETTAEELETFCRARLAGYKVPRRLRFLDELPRTASGKVAKRLLREGSTGFLADP